MPQAKLTKETFLSAMRNASDSDECIKEAVSLIKSYGKDCVDIMCRLRSGDIKSTGIEGRGISKFLLKTAKSLREKGKNRLVQKVHFYCLYLLKRGEGRNRKNKEIKQEMAKIYEILFSKKLDENQYSSNSDKDEAIERIKSLACEESKISSELTIEAARFLWRHKEFKQAAQLAETIQEDSDHYQDACFYLGGNLIKRASDTGLNSNSTSDKLDDYGEGLRFLAKITDRNGGKHPYKCQETRTLIGKAKAGINELREPTEFKFFVRDKMGIIRGAKKSDKQCEIPDIDPDKTGFTLHERQSLVENVIASNGKHKPKVGFSSRFNFNLLVVSIGFICTNIPWEKSGSHKRVFHSIPLNYDDSLVLDSISHTESFLYDSFLKKEEDLKGLISLFKENFIKEDGHKIYGIVIDCHSSNDMCIDCVDETERLFRDFESMVKVILLKQGFCVPQKDGSFSMTMRFTSSSPYLSGLRQHIEGDNKAEEDNEKIDIHGYRRLMIHGSKQWHSLWGKGKGGQPDKKIDIELWTTLSTSGRAAPDPSEKSVSECFRSGESPSEAGPAASNSAAKNKYQYGKGKLNLKEFSMFNTSSGVKKENSLAASTTP